MAVPSSISSLSTTASVNPPNGAENPFPDLDDHLRAIYSFTAYLRDNKADSSALAGYLSNTVNAWKNDSTTLARFYFEGSSGGLGGTYVRGYGNNPFWVQRADGSSVFTVTSDGRLNCIADATNSSDVPRKGQMDGAIAAASLVSSALSFSSLSVSASGASSNVSISAAELLARDESGNPRLLSNISLTLNSAASGANGLDAGSLAVNTWYAVWVIWNGTTTASLLSPSSTSPTLPSGYTHKARVGWIRTDGTGNKYPLAFDQDGRSVTYRVAPSTNVTATPVVASGVQGTIGAPVWASFSLTDFIPATAKRYIAQAYLSNAGGGHAVMVAPSSNYGAYATLTNPPPISLDIPNFTGYAPSVQAVLRNIDGNVYYMSDCSGARLGVIGWEDNL